VSEKKYFSDRRLPAFVSVPLSMIVVARHAMTSADVRGWRNIPCPSRASIASNEPSITTVAPPLRAEHVARFR